MSRVSSTSNNTTIEIYEANSLTQKTIGKPRDLRSEVGMFKRKINLLKVAPTRSLQKERDELHVQHFIGQCHKPSLLLDKLNSTSTSSSTYSSSDMHLCQTALSLTRSSATCEAFMT